MRIPVDAIRASLRIYQAVPRPVVRDDVVGPVPTPNVEEARAGPRPIEGSAAGQSSRDAPDARTRDGPTDRARVPEAELRSRDGPTDPARELRARDMKTRAEYSASAPDGSLRSLPSFEYTRGPDGKLYAIGAAPLAHTPVAEDEASSEVHGPEPPIAAPREQPPPREQPTELRSHVDARAMRSADEPTRDTSVQRTRDGPETSKVASAYVRAAEDEPPQALADTA